MSQVIEDVACVGCCSVCDDLQLTTDGSQITEVQTTCPEGQVWLDRVQQTEPLVPAIQGKTVALSAAMDRAVELIQQSQAPLIYGMFQSTTESQRAAIALADQIGACIDTGATAATRALQQVGEAPCSLGEVRIRADLVIYWGANAFQSHETGRQQNQGSKTKTACQTVTIGTDSAESSDDSDHCLSVASGTEFEFIWSLRGLLKGVTLEENQCTGFSTSDLQTLASLIQDSRYIVFYLGPEFRQASFTHRNLEALSLLVRELQADRRCHSLNVPGTGETKGADTVLAWQTGYSASVNFSAGYPRYSPSEYSASQLIEQSETDLCLLVGSQPLSGLSDQAREKLKQTPLILIGAFPLDGLIPEVTLPTGVYGVHYPGVVYRLDGTPLPLRGFLPTDLQSEAETLNRLLQGIRQA